MKQFPIGVFGGTFDPIHLGHIHLATTIYRLCSLQKVLLIPCRQSPLRNSPVAPALDRFNMAQLAIKDLPFLHVDDYEIRQPAVSYTSKTLEHLSQKNNPATLAVIMGSDAFNRFNEWHAWRRILELAHLIVVNRENHPPHLTKEAAEILAEKQIFTPFELQKKRSGLIYLVDIKPLSIAATEIRELIRQQKEASHLVAPQVWQYIDDNKLYTEPVDKI